ncbi:MAG: hypothetical protein JO263_08730 [Candidatus Eremiobacteraeota bacterium]|nr:hypothetical protein [Candidatus Eremiobacteraeota bacterium]
MRGMLAMQVAPELGIPEVKPAIEMVRGRLQPGNVRIFIDPQIAVGDAYPDLRIELCEVFAGL